jgi:hypothetical protein
MPAEARFRIRADSDDLDRGVSKLRGFEQEIAGFFARQQGGTRRAELAITGALREFSTGNVAGGLQLITSRLGSLGLVGSVVFGGLTAGLVLADKAAKESAKSFADTRDILARPLPKNAGIEQLQKDLDETTKKIEENEQKNKGGFLATAGNAYSFAKAFVTGDDPNKILKELGSRNEEINKLTAHRGDLLELLSKAEREHNIESRAGAEIGDIRAQKLALETKAQSDLAKQHEVSLEVLQKYNREKEGVNDPEKLSRINALQSQETNRDMKASAEIVDDLTKKLDDLNKKQEKGSAIGEKSKLSFQELLQVPSIRLGGPIGLQDSARQARAAQREMQLGEAARMKGLTSEAAKHFDLAEQIKFGIAQLRTADKSPEYAFRAALNGSEVLNNMLGQLNSINSGVNAISIVNQ